jgi:hypothetical protein
MSRRADERQRRGAHPDVAAKTYRLDADDAKLTPHVGPGEISGTLVQRRQRTPSASAASSSASVPKLKVDTVKMVAANCALVEAK